MRELFFNFFGYAVFFFSLCLISSYAIMMILSGWGLLRKKDMTVLSYDKELIATSPYTPGVSIVAPAYNEELTIVENVKSLLDQNYPVFEVIIANDGSTDKTLEKLIENFGLVEVPYVYIERINTKPYKRLFKSKLPEYERLTVVDKENGGTKADAENAGLNVAKYPYFINTDVDCILSRDAIFQCIKPVLQDKNIIAVSGAMTMSNGCKVVDGKLLNHKAPWSPVPLFQTLEYMRSYFVGKMAWSAINGMPNVSGGYGLFNREVMIAAGGYTYDSFAEDMDMLLNAVRYCRNFNRPYKIVQIPFTCCWTQGPGNLKILYRQRTRWGRGLFQTFVRHRDLVFNPKYRQMGLITLPYLLVFEFLAPIIEVSGLIEFIYLAIRGGINWGGAVVIFFGLYTFCLLIVVVTMSFDFIAGSTFDKNREYFKVALAGMFEFLFYHPFITTFSLIGYGKFLLRTRSKWGKMTRQSYTTVNQENTNANTEVATPSSSVTQ